MDRTYLLLIKPEGKFVTKQDIKASVDALAKHLFLSNIYIEAMVFTQKSVNTAFLSRKFENTRSSIAFKDMLWSSIAPQIVLLSVFVVIFDKYRDEQACLHDE